MPCERTERLRGATGAAGTVPTNVPKVGSNGTGGNDALALADPGFLPIAIPQPWLLGAIHDAELAMVNNQPDAALVDLLWLTHLVQAAESSGFGGDAVQAAEKRIIGLIRLIAHGLDVFGRNFNYVSLTHFDTMSSLVATQLDYLTGAEGLYEKLAAETASWNTTRLALGNAEKLFASNVKSAEAEIARISDDSSRLQDEISRLYDELTKIHEQLIRAEAKFKDAVQKREGCLTFPNILKLGAMVATVVVTAGAGSALLAASATAMGALGTLMDQGGGRSPSLDPVSLAGPEIDPATPPSPGSPPLASMEPPGFFSEAGRILKPVQGKGQAFAKGFTELIALYDELNPKKPSIPDVLDRAEDRARLVASKDEFDAAIKPYLKLPEAKAYQALMHRYIATAETRNNKILEFDRGVIEVAQIQARTKLQLLTIQQLSETTAANFDARLPENLAFTKDGLETLKWGLVRQFVSMEKTLEFMTGESPNTIYNDFSVGALKITATSLVQSYTQALEAFGQDAAPGEDFSRKLVDLLGNEQLDAFLNGDVVTLAINEIDDTLFDSLYGVQTRRIHFVGSDGKPIPHEFRVTATHLGRSVVRQSSGSSQVYAHVPVSAFYSVNAFQTVSAKGDLMIETPGAVKRYVGASPYGPWRIRLSNASDGAKAALRDGYLSFDILYRTISLA